MIPYGSMIIFVAPNGKRYLKKLEQHVPWQSSFGCLSSEKVHKASYGDIIETHINNPILLERVTLYDRLLHLKRQTQIIYPKDIAYICLRLGAGPAKVIAEAGCGSGALTIALSWFCGESGKVISQDAREEFINLTRRNLEWAEVGENVELVHKDLSEGFIAKNVDAVFLDMREPWLFIDQALDALVPGGTLGFLLPTINQINELLLALEKKQLGNIEVEELLIRQWKPVPDRLRPKDRMTAHTGFLVFCRQQHNPHLFVDEKKLDTRERKQREAWEQRNNF